VRLSSKVDRHQLNFRSGIPSNGKLQRKVLTPRKLTGLFRSPCCAPVECELVFSPLRIIIHFAIVIHTSKPTPFPSRLFASANCHSLANWHLACSAADIRRPRGRLTVRFVAAGLCPENCPKGRECDHELSEKNHGSVVRPDGVLQYHSHAYQLNSFRVRIEDANTGVGRVLTDNATLGSLNSSGDENATTGTIDFSGSLENFVVNIQATSTTANPDGSGGGILTLSGKVNYTGTTNAQIMITLEDNSYTAPAPQATLVESVGGYDDASRTVTPTGGLTGAATSVGLQSWLDVTNTDPAFGANSGPTLMNPSTLVMPASTSSTTFTAGAQQFTTSGFANTGVAVPVTFSGANYSIFSQATVNFSDIGTADFTVKAADPVDESGTPVPEPTPLMLLGAGLIGLEFLRRKKVL